MTASAYKTNQAETSIKRSVSAAVGAFFSSGGKSKVRPVKSGYQVRTAAGKMHRFTLAFVDPLLEEQFVKNSARHRQRQAVRTFCYGSPLFTTL